MAPGKKGIGKRDRQLLSFWSTIRSAKTTIWNVPNKSKGWSLEPCQPLENLMPFPWHPHSAVINWQPSDPDSFLSCLSLQPSPDPRSQFGKVTREAQVWQKPGGITGSPHVRLAGANGFLLVVMEWCRNAATASETASDRLWRCCLYAYSAKYSLHPFL